MFLASLFYLKNINDPVLRCKRSHSGKAVFVTFCRKNGIEFGRLKYNMYFCKQNINSKINKITKTNG